MEHIKQTFEEDGYVVIEGLFTEDEINALKSECRKLIQNMPQQSKRTVFSTTNPEAQQNKDEYFLDSWNKISYFYESEALKPNGELKVAPELSLNKIGHALHDLNPVFRKLTFDQRIRDCCLHLGFGDPVVVQSMYIFKNPTLGGEVVAHQDASYLYTEPVKLVGFWIALEDATIENGCLWFAKGSHKNGVDRRYIRNPDPNSGELLIYTNPAPVYEKSSFNAAPVKKGSCVLIHGLVVHYSEQNKSKQSRNAYAFHVIDNKDTIYFKDNWIQPTANQPFLRIYEN